MNTSLTRKKFLIRGGVAAAAMRLRFLLILVVLLAFTARAQQQTNPIKDDPPETVVDTLHVRAGKEDELAKAMARAWAAYRTFDMVLPQPHLLMRGVDDAGRPFLVEILTWKDHAAPDHAPAEVQKIWVEMEALCEKRDGRRGIEFYEVRMLQ
jgi:hypothetical protein